MRRSAIPLRLLFTALIAGLLSGCDSSPKRQEVTGTVIFRGQPLDEGIIDFEPMDGQGSKSGASILNGEYHIPQEKGLFPGRYKVSIVAGDGVKTSGNAEPSGRLPPGVTPGKERIPPEYNVRSNVIREIKKDGPNQIDFTIP
jgi:hypothetical protein